MEPIARLEVHVQPGARQTGVVAVEGGVARLQVAAPPVEGKANDAVVELLAAALGVRRHAVTLLRGATGRTKLVEVSGMTAEVALERLRAAAQAGLRGPR